ncbi:MAG: AbrB/MazE/SpoVT family DNA-binding domain-containing protein [Anaerolineales bacterium]
MSPKVSKVQQNGQVTIPIEIRKKWGLEPGDLVAFVETEAGVLILPQEEKAAREALDRIGEVLKAKGITIEEMMEDGREIRGQLLEEEYGIHVEEE